MTVRCNANEGKRKAKKKEDREIVEISGISKPQATETVEECSKNSPKPIWTTPQGSW
jgi:hypothetical protein